MEMGVRLRAKGGFGVIVSVIVAVTLQHRKTNRILFGIRVNAIVEASSDSLCAQVRVCMEVQVSLSDRGGTFSGFPQQLTSLNIAIPCSRPEQFLLRHFFCLTVCRKTPPIIWREIVRSAK